MSYSSENNLDQIIAGCRKRDRPSQHALYRLYYAYGMSICIRYAEPAFSHNTSFTDINWEYLFTLAAKNMNPHLGQAFELRVVDTDLSSEVGRFSLAEILVPNFFIRVPGLKLGGHYNIDYYADLNQNGSYDAPPVDHAWRDDLVDDEGDETIDFTHNINFTDIQFPVTPVKEILSLVSALIYPNPFAGSLNVNFQLDRATSLSVYLTDEQGKTVFQMTKQDFSSGTHNITLDDLPYLAGGIYYLVLKTNAGAIQGFQVLRI